MADLTSTLYPAPPTNGFANLGPSGVIGLVNGINQAKLFQQQYDARQGVADAYRNNVDANGIVNQPGLTRDLARSGFGAGEALHQGTVNAASQFDLQTRQNQFLRDSIGTIADMPNPTKADLARLGVSIARNIPTMPVEELKRHKEELSILEMPADYLMAPGYVETAPPPMATSEEREEFNRAFSHTVTDLERVATKLKNRCQSWTRLTPEQQNRELIMAIARRLAN
jgi:hypothetical protein